jgi:hypothetical protein
MGMTYRFKRTEAQKASRAPSTDAQKAARAAKDKAARLAKASAALVVAVQSDPSNPQVVALPPDSNSSSNPYARFARLFNCVKGGVTLLDRALKIDRANVIIQIARDAVKATVRRIYYLCSGQGIVAKSEKGQRQLNDVLLDARWNGVLPWSTINDGGRSLDLPNHWDSIEDFLEDVPLWFTLDQWTGQPVRVVLCVEKDTLDTILTPLCRELHVPYISFHGNSSDSLLYELAEWIEEQLRDKTERVVCLYLGDHDPAGLNIDRIPFGGPTVTDVGGIDDTLPKDLATLRDDKDPRWLYYGKLRLLLVRFFHGDSFYAKVEYRRIGIVAEDVDNPEFDNFKLEAHEFVDDENGHPTTVKNKLYSGFMERTGGDSRTLGIDAISPEDLIERARAAIMEYVDEDIWDGQKKANARQVELLKERVSD